MTDQFKLFIGGLSADTTTESLHDHFAAYGTITDCVVMVDCMCRSRGFGFVTYEGQEAYDYVLNAGGQVIVDGKTVEAKPTDGKKPQGGGGQGFQSRQSGAIRCGKVFVGGIQGLSTESLASHFEQYGELTDAIAMVDAKGSARGFGFVTFADPSMLHQVVNMEHYIEGHKVDVKPADGQHGRQAFQQPGQQGRQAYQNLGHQGQQGYGRQPSRAAEGNKIFVGGLPNTVNTERLHDLFQMYGQIIDCVSFTNRGFGYVTFAVHRAMKAALAVGNVHIDGKVVQIKPCDVPRDGDGSGYGRTTPRFGPPAARGYGPQRAGRNAEGKIFVGGLGQHTTNESFRAYWETNYGELSDYVVMTDATGRTRGFGFVTFTDPSMADDALALQHVIDGQPVDCKLADGNRDGAQPPRAPSGGYGGGYEQEETSDPRKVFIGGLPETITTDGLQQHMSEFGEIVDAIAMSSRGFGYVTFAESHCAAAALGEQKLMLDGKECEIKPCTVPRRKTQPPPRHMMGARARPY